MQVGLFGGSFNPPHLGHLVIAEVMREQFGLDRVLWMPSYQTPHKQGARDMAGADHRLAMTRLATASNPGFAVSDLEVQRQGVSYTVDTLRTLQAEQPETAFAFILGGDSLRGFASWHEPDEILKRVPLLVYERPGVARPTLLPAHATRIRFARAPLLEISGTAVRQRCRHGQSIRYFVPDDVRAYIAEHQLYRP